MSDIDVTASIADRGSEIRLKGQVIPPPGTTVGNVLTATAAGSSWQAAAAGGLTVLFDQTLLVDTATIDSGAGGFSTTFNVLLVYFIVRTDAGTAFDTVSIRVNNDSGAKYEQTQEQNTNAAVSGSSQQGQTSWQLNARAGGSTSNYASVYSMQMPGYGQTTFMKSATTQEANNDSTAANQNVTLRAVGFRDAAAITRIAILGQGASKLKAGSRMLVYGV